MPAQGNRNTTLLPLVFALVMIAGIVLGYFLTPGTQPYSRFPFGKQRDDKVNDIINYVYYEYVDSLGKQELNDHAIRGIIHRLDPHTQYISADEFNDLNDPLIGNFEGIGIEFRMIEDTVTVVWSIEGGPSYEAGLLPGDRIIAVDDTAIAGRGLSSQEVTKYIKGDKGTATHLVVARRGVIDLLHISLIRQVIPTYSISAGLLVNESTGYIKLSKFSATTVAEFSETSSGLLSKGMKNLILDLRGNTGGYLQTAVKIADEFLEKDRMIVYTEGYNRRRTEYLASSSGNCEFIDLVILIDGRSASASEIIAGAIQDNDRGTIVGRRSYGKGLVQEQVTFPDGSALRLTVARYYTPSGRCIQKPYSKNETGFGEYFSEPYTRYLNGELEYADSIPLSDTIPFKTQGGKTVYAGGGIIPDIYIPLKSDSRYAFLHKLHEKDLFIRFVFDFQHTYGTVLSGFSTIEEFFAGFTVTDKMLADFFQYCKTNNISGSGEEIAFAQKEIETLIAAYFARIRFGEPGFLRIALTVDETFQKASEVLNQ